jgi:hypothetical protein
VANNVTAAVDVPAGVTVMVVSPPPSAKQRRGQVTSQ